MRIALALLALLFLDTVALGLGHDWLSGGVYVALMDRLAQPSTDVPRARSNEIHP